MTPADSIQLVSPRTLIVACLLALSAGCSLEGRTPDPSNSAIQAQVLEQATTLLRDALIPRMATDVTGIHPSVLVDYGYPDLTYDAWVARKDDNDKFAEVVAEVDSVMEALSPTIENIRVESKEPELNRITCLADMPLGNGNECLIRFQLQYTESGDTYITVEIIE